jgi:hypothetical protein
MFRKIFFASALLVGMVAWNSSKAEAQPITIQHFPSVKPSSSFYPPIVRPPIQFRDHYHVLYRDSRFDRFRTYGIYRSEWQARQVAFQLRGFGYQTRVVEHDR